MAFDRTNAGDLLALKTEVNTDPIGMGYDPVGPTQVLLKQLNDPDNNVNNDVIARPFDVLAMMDALDPTEYDAPQTATDAAVYVHTLVELAAFQSIEAYKTKFRSLFAANSATVTNLDAQTKEISRAEVLFGVDTNITRDDWIAARGS